MRQPIMAPPPSPTPTESDRDLLSTPPPSSSSGKRQPPLLPLIGKKKKRSKRRREAAEGKPPAQAEAHAERERERGAALLRRAARAAMAEKQVERPNTGWLDSFTQMGVAIYGRNNKLLVPGQKQEDPEAVAERAASMLMWSRRS
jgi:hypothetical protein